MRNSSLFIYIIFYLFISTFIACKTTLPSEVSPTESPLGLPTTTPSVVLVSGTPPESIAIVTPTSIVAEQLSNPTIPPKPTPVSGSSQAVESTPSNTFTPITARLILSKVPDLNELVKLTFVFSSTLEAPQTTATIALPSGAVLVEGNLEWAGDLKANVPQNLEATIRFDRKGNWVIEAKALHEVGNGDIWGDSAYFYLHVSDEISHLGFPTEPRPQPADQTVPTPPSVNPSP